MYQFVFNVSILFIILIVLIDFSCPYDPDTEWEIFKYKFQKRYPNAKAEEYRKRVFTENLKAIENNNDNFIFGNSNRILSIDENSDLKPEELFQEDHSKENIDKFIKSKPYYLLR